MTSDAHATPATNTDAKPAAKPARTPQRPDVTDKAAREIMAAERKAQQAKTERLRAARLAAEAAEPVVVTPAPKRRAAKAAH